MSQDVKHSTTMGKDDFGDRVKDPKFNAVLIWVDDMGKKLGRCYICPDTGDAAIEPMIFVQHTFGFSDNVIEKKTVAFCCSNCGRELAKFNLGMAANAFFKGMRPGELGKIIDDLYQMGTSYMKSKAMGVKVEVTDCDDPNCPEHSKSVQDTKDVH